MGLGGQKHVLVRVPGLNFKNIQGLTPKKQLSWTPDWGWQEGARREGATSPPWLPPSAPCRGRCGESGEASREAQPLADASDGFGGLRRHLSERPLRSRSLEPRVTQWCGSLPAGAQQVPTRQQHRRQSQLCHATCAALQSRSPACLPVGKRSGPLPFFGKSFRRIRSAACVGGTER